MASRQESPDVGDLRERSLPELLRQLSQEITQLLKQEIELATGGVVHGFNAISNDGGGEAGRPQPLFNEPGDAFFVFGNEYADHGGPQEKPGAGRPAELTTRPRALPASSGLLQNCGVSCT